MRFELIQTPTAHAKEAKVAEANRQEEADRLDLQLGHKSMPQLARETRARDAAEMAELVDHPIDHRFGALGAAVSSTNPK